MPSHSITTASASATGAAYLIPPGTGELRWMGQTGTCFLATGQQTSGGFCLVDERAAMGESVPLHRHEADMESFYVLEGALTIYLGDGPGLRAEAGAFAHVPAGAVHGFRVESESARYLILTTPHHGEFYRAITRPVQGESVGGAAIGQACQDFGIEYIGPLPAVP